MVTSCYGCAGQRCMASSAIVTVGVKSTIRSFPVCRRLEVLAAIRWIKYENRRHADGAGHFGKNRAFIESMMIQGVDEGATLALDGRGLQDRDARAGYFHPDRPCLQT